MTEIHTFLPVLEREDRPTEAEDQDGPSASPYDTGYKAGYEKGLTEGLQLRAASRGNAMDKLGGQVEALRGNLDEITRQHGEASLTLFHSCLEQLLPELTRQAFWIEIEPVVEKLLKSLPAVELQLTLPEDLLEAAQARFATMDGDERMTVKGCCNDEAHREVGVRAQLTWADGEAEFDPGRACREILKRFHHFCGQDRGKPDRGFKIRDCERADGIRERDGEDDHCNNPPSRS